MEEFTIEQIFFPDSCFTNAMNAIKDKECNRDLMAEFYADCIRASCEHGMASIDWPILNNAILARWPKGLDYIKKAAWKKRRPAIGEKGHANL